MPIRRAYRFLPVAPVLALCALLTNACGSSHTTATGSGASTSGNGGGGGATPATLPFQVSAAPSTGAVAGLVRDFDTHSPVSGAAVTILGGAATTTAANGTFSITAPLGRANVSVTLSGYVVWQGVLPVGSRTLPVRINLHTATASQTIQPSGSTITAGSASLSFPAAAYAAPTTITATWLTGSQVIASTWHPQFMNASMNAFRVVGVLDVAVPTEPGAPVTVTLPVPAGVDPTTVALVSRAADGTRSAPLAPSTTGSGTATFTVPHFSPEDLVVPIDPNRPSEVFNQIDDGVTVTDSMGSTCAAQDGDRCVGDVSATVPPGASLSLHDITDSLLWYANTAQTLKTIAVRAAKNELMNAQAWMDDQTNDAFGEFRTDASILKDVYYSAHAAAVDAMFNRWNLTINDPGTVFTVTSDACPSSDGARTIFGVETAQGNAVVFNNGVMTPVAAGQQADACEGCATPTDPPVCCDASNCATGCCAPRRARLSLRASLATPRRPAEPRVPHVATAATARARTAAPVPPATTARTRSSTTALGVAT